MNKYFFVFAAVCFALGIAIAAASLAGEPQHEKTFQISDLDMRVVQPSELADCIVEGKRDFVVFDMKPEGVDEKAEPPIPGAVRCPACHEDAQQGRAFLESLPASVDLAKRLLFYDESGSANIELPRKVFRKSPFVCGLDGGYQAWKREFVDPVDFSPDDDLPTRQAKLKRQALRAYFAGESLTSDAVAAPPPPPVLKRVRAPAATGADEGC